MNDKYTTDDVSRVTGYDITRVQRYALSKKMKKWGKIYVFTKRDINLMRKTFEITDSLAKGNVKT